MLFNSPIFLFVFLPLTLAGYHLLLRGEQSTLARTWLVLCSFVFYAWWNPWFLSLIIISATIDFFVGARIHASQDKGKRRAWVVLSLFTNLGLLAVFK